MPTPSQNRKALDRRTFLETTKSYDNTVVDLPCFKDARSMFNPSQKSFEEDRKESKG